MVEMGAALGQSAWLATQTWTALEHSVPVTTAWPPGSAEMEPLPRLNTALYRWETEAREVR